MSGSLALLLVALIAGLAAAAFFALAEGVLFAAPGPREEIDGEARRGPFRHLHHAQHGVALGHLLAVVWVGATAWPLTVALAGGAPDPVEGIAAVLGGSFLALVVGELIPRAVGTEEPWRWRRWLRRPLAAWLGVLRPVTSLVALVDRAISQAVGPGPGVRGLPSQDVRTILAETSVRAARGLDERQMIVSIFSFGETTVREVMTPRPDVFALSVETPIEEAVTRIREAENSRVPVYRDGLDDVVGVLYAKDLLAFVHGGERPDGLESILREARFVPEAKRIDELLREFQRERIHLAVVVDEYGGTEGIVTLEDILEELVGEIQDEYDRERPRVQTLDDGRLLLDAGLDADDFNTLTGSGIGADGVETMGGVVSRALGRVAEAGDEVEIAGWSFEVDEVEGKRITRMKAARAGGDDNP